MKILWITNIVFPEALRLLSENNELRASGGWMLGASSGLLENYPELELFVATVTPKVNKITVLKGESIIHFLIPYGKGNLKKNPEYDKYWKLIKEDVHPDIVHIYGTEFSHGLSYINSCGNSNVVVSIQGLVSDYAHYFYGGLSSDKIFSNISIRDVISGDGILSGKRKYEARGAFETEIIKKSKYIIGRTTWDKAHVWAVNPNAQYCFCNETLRDDFYDGKWEYHKCKKNTIFITQGWYPIKGLHKVLEALPLVLRHYPDCKLRIAGMKFNYEGFIGRQLRPGYHNIIQNLITKNQLDDVITFIGPLDSAQIKQELLSANLFVIPSAIENSPNSLGEAQMLGVPCLSSYVGGVPDLIPMEDRDSMYRFDDVEMLAYKIVSKLKESNSFDSTMEITAAKIRHNRGNNAATLMRIYNGMINDKGTSI